MTDARAERRLAAILAGDIVGYSRLMGADEEGTLARVNAVRREFWEPKIAEHRGRIVKRTGDGVLIEFASVVDDDLVLHAQPDVFTRMPEPSKRALVLLERALALDPNYALAHAYAAECYHSLFLRGGLHEEHHMASVQHALEASLALSPSSAITYIQGSVILAIAGESERAIEWAERGLRLSPFDLGRASAFFSIAAAHFNRGR